MRTAIYVYGFNFYYGAVKDTTYKWLNPKHCVKLYTATSRYRFYCFCTA